MPQAEFVGRVLEATATRFWVGSRVSRLEQSALSFGSLVRVAAEKAPQAAPSTQIYGIISQIRLRSDQLVESIAPLDQIEESIYSDQHQRNLPIQIEVLVLGHKTKEGQISYLLPPRPPLTLARLYTCSPEEVREFTSRGWGYLRHMLHAEEAPVEEMIAVHLKRAAAAHKAAGNENWLNEALHALINLLRDDARLMTVLRAVNEVVPAAA